MSLSMSAMPCTRSSRRVASASPAWPHLRRPLTRTSVRSGILCAGPHVPQRALVPPMSTARRVVAGQHLGRRQVHPAHEAAFVGVVAQGHQVHAAAALVEQLGRAVYRELADQALPEAAADHDAPHALP